MSPFTGIALKLISVVLFVIMAALIKATTDEIPIGQAIFFRSSLAMIPIMIYLAWRHELSTGLKVKSRSAHLWRGFIGSCGMGFGFASLGLLPLPEVTAIGFAGPMLTVILAAIFLGERLRAFRLTAVIVGLIGVAIILSPRLTIFSNDALDGAAQLGVVFVLLSALFRSIVQIHMRRMAQTEQTSAIVFYFSLTSSLIGLSTLPFGWVVPSAHMLMILIAAGLVGGVAQLFITSAYRFADASVIAPFDYASILFALVIGYVVFSEVPTVQMLIGSAVVISAGILIIWRERQLGLGRGKARPSLTPHG